MPDPTPERVAELLEAHRRVFPGATTIQTGSIKELALAYRPLAASWQRQRAALAEKDALLRECEWLPIGVGGEVLCPACDSEMHEGHAPDCRLRAALPAEESEGKDPGSFRSEADGDR